MRSASCGAGKMLRSRRATAGRTLLAARQRRHAHHRDPNTGHQSRGRHLLGSSYNFSRNDRKGTYSIVGYTPSFQELRDRPPFGRFFNEIDMEQQRKVCDHRVNLAGAVPGWRKSGRPHDPDEQHLFDGRRRDGRIERGHKFPLGCLRVAPARHSATDVQHGQAPAPRSGWWPMTAFPFPASKRA